MWVWLYVLNLTERVLQNININININIKYIQVEVLKNLIE